MTDLTPERESSHLVRGLALMTAIVLVVFALYVTAGIKFLHGPVGVIVKDALYERPNMTLVSNPTFLWIRIYWPLVEVAKWDLEDGNHGFLAQLILGDPPKP